MPDARDFNHRHSKVFSTDNMKLTRSASEQNVYFTYVCLIDDIRPSQATVESEQFERAIHSINNEPNQPEELPIQVERTKAFYELVDVLNNDAQSKEPKDTSAPQPETTKSDENEPETEETNNFISWDNPNVLKLTKMKWLTETDENEGDNMSSPSISPATSSTSWCSKNSKYDANKYDDFDDKYLSTILRLDKEHNMFGLSSIAIIGSRPSKQKRAKDDEKAVFHQTAIVQVCCKSSCCRNMSRTDLPTSLKCKGCRSCCSTACGYCASKCSVPCPKARLLPEPCALPCTPCGASCGRNCSCRGTCARPCKTDCNSCFGLKIKLNRKPKYEPGPCELTPRSSCILGKPFAARPCTHTPQCVPPSNCFPYLMPCFWPSRPSAPCTDPTRCFHNPPCPAPRNKAKVPLPPQYTCPKHGVPCENKAKNTTCTNEVCPGVKECYLQTRARIQIWKIITMLSPDGKSNHCPLCGVLHRTLDPKKKPKKKRHVCQCMVPAIPTCKNCFVRRHTPLSQPQPRLKKACEGQVKVMSVESFGSHIPSVSSSITTRPPSPSC